MPPETSPFARAGLEHRLVMVDDDIKLEALPQTNHLKTIVTAEMEMDLEKKGEQLPPCRMSQTSRR